MEARQALDEITNVIAKLDALSVLRDVLVVASEAETRVKDAEARFAEVDLLVQNARLTLTDVQQKIEDKLVELDKEAELRKAKVEREIEAIRVGGADYEKALAVRIADARNQLAAVQSAVAAAIKDKEGVDAQIETANARLDKLRADIKALQSGVSAIPA